ncbi:hypothetical protein AB1N83_012852, partial [Pleurotus pulmonarius]
SGVVLIYQESCCSPPA